MEMTRAGNMLIWFPSESIVFVQKWANEDSLKKINDLLIPSFLVSQIRDSLTSLISSERPEWIAHGRSFLVSDLSDSLTLLIWFEWNERFTHIAHQL